MMQRQLYALVFLILAAPLAWSKDQVADFDRDILVTFDNSGAGSVSRGGATPYRFRKRYTISNRARQDAREVAASYSLVEIDHWPIKSLSVYCFVYRVSADADRDDVIRRLASDDRVESVQALHEFKTETAPQTTYDDTYVNLQHSLKMLDVTAAHRYSTGQGIRVVIIDSHADVEHEDLRGRLRKVEVFSARHKKLEKKHGTAVASVIGAKTNNARGIVGVAPEALMELLVSCWEEPGAPNAVCTSFTLAKALDAMLEDPPHILNMSLAGPADPLLRRLLLKAHAANVIIVSASPRDTANRFPASVDVVIGVESRPLEVETGSPLGPTPELYAPGHQILVALPEDDYDFRSGSSLAAAHVTGVIALLLSVSPQLSYEEIRAMLYESQDAYQAAQKSVNACLVLHLDDGRRACN